MTRSNKILSAIALAGFTLSAVGLMAAPFDQSARAAEPAKRIDAAFSLVQPAVAGPAAVRAVKADLELSRACAEQTWPNIASECLVTGEGSPVSKARMVTVGHQSGEAETVLVRLPIADIAMR